MRYLAFSSYSQAHVDIVNLSLAIRLPDRVAVILGVIFRRYTAQLHNLEAHLRCRLGEIR